MATISDVLLRTVVGVRLEAGVSIADIRRLVDRFAADETSNDGDTGIVGFLGIEDIPQHRREAFLVEVADLPIPASGAGVATVHSLQLSIDRLKAERRSALDGEAFGHARMLLAEMERLQEQKRDLLRRIGAVAAVARCIASHGIALSHHG